MRDREVDRFTRANPDVADLVATWRAEHPVGTLRDAVVDLELWPRKPDDKDVQWFVWCKLRDQGDPVAAEGFPVMRAEARPAGARHTRVPDREAR